MKTIPNCISFSRIIFSLILVFIKPLSVAFYAIYIICGLSDIMDGFIARKTGTTSISAIEELIIQLTSRELD